jgi:hypothetical protein
LDAAIIQTAKKKIASTIPKEAASSAGCGRRTYTDIGTAAGSCRSRAPPQEGFRQRILKRGQLQLGAFDLDARCPRHEYGEQQAHAQLYPSPRPRRSAARWRFLQR